MLKNKSRMKHVPVKKTARLRTIRRGFGETQTSLAQKARISQTLISKIELENRGLTPLVKKKIAMALNVDEEELFPKEE